MADLDNGSQLLQNRTLNVRHAEALRGFAYSNKDRLANYAKLSKQEKLDVLKEFQAAAGVPDSGSKLAIREAFGPDGSLVRRIASLVDSKENRRTSIAYVRDEIYVQTQESINSVSQFEKEMLPVAKKFMENNLEAIKSTVTSLPVLPKQSNEPFDFLSPYKKKDPLKTAVVETFKDFDYSNSNRTYLTPDQSTGFRITLDFGKYYGDLDINTDAKGQTKVEFFTFQPDLTSMLKVADMPKSFREGVSVILNSSGPDGNPAVESDLDGDGVLTISEIKEAKNYQAFEALRSDYAAEIFSPEMIAANAKNSPALFAKLSIEEVAEALSAGSDFPEGIFSKLPPENLIPIAKELIKFEDRSGFNRLLRGLPESEESRVREAVERLTDEPQKKTDEN